MATPSDKTPEALTCNCLLLCEEVLTGHARPRHMLHGVIGSIRLKEALSVIGPLAIYVRVSNVYPGADLRIEFAHGNEEADPLFSLAITFPPEADPLAMHTFIIQMPPFAVPADGRYILRAVSNEDVVNLTPVEVRFTSGDKDDDFN